MKNYQQDGFAIFDQPLIASQLLANASARVDAIRAGECDTGHQHWGMTAQNKADQLQRISQIHLCDQAFHDLLTHSGIGAQLAECVGAKQLKIWGSQLYIKPPSIGHSVGGNVGWHRDSQHIHFYRNGLFTLWIPLGATQSESGPITYIRGSHQSDAFALPIGAGEQNLDQDRQLLRVDNPHEWDEVEVIVPQGGLSIHHWDMIHGSGHNATQEPRYGLSVGVATEKIEVGTGWDYGYHGILDDEFMCPTLF